MDSLLNRKIGKIGIVIFAILILAPLNVYAVSSVPKPSTPEYTVQFIDYSYNKPTTYTMDPYTGQQVENPGHYVQNKCIVFTIKNQQFTPSIDTRFFYNIRMKGQYEENWTELYRPAYGYIEQTANSDYTIIAYTWNPHGDTWIGTREILLRAGGKADFQVQAMIGQITRAGPYSGEFFDGEKSQWSGTQTITIDETSATPIVTEKPTQTQTSTDATFTQVNVTLDLYWKQIAIPAIVTVAILGIALAFVITKKAKNKQQGN